jgi:hypothetical protein
MSDMDFRDTADEDNTTVHCGPGSAPVNLANYRPSLSL